MSFRHRIRASWRRVLGGAILCAGVGLALLYPDFGLVLSSYDFLFYFRKPQVPAEAIIIYMDDRSFKTLHQENTSTWDRNLHAQLVDHLTADRCRLVVFDLVFDRPGAPDADTNLARAIRANGRVVLAAARDFSARPQIRVASASLPTPEFLNAAAGWGYAELASAAGTVARRYFSGDETEPGLPWAAARLAVAPGTNAPNPDPENIWLNYYGPAFTIDHLSYCDVKDQPPGYFKDRCVFVGVRPKTLKRSEEADAFRTPHTLWTRSLFPGTEIGATAFLNLLRHEGLVRLAGAKEVWLVLASGFLFGGVLGLLRPLLAGIVAVIGAVLMLLSALQASNQHVWFAWSVVAFGQIPCAFAGSVRGHFHRLKFQKEVLEQTLVETARRTDASAATARSAGPVIPDHTLVRRVGKGAYGEVWLARNAIGAYHAVKIVQRREFPGDSPYEREFKGIQKFMPISRSHAGFVHVLHVGRKEDFFFYIMEVCDDASSGQRIDPESYSAKTLGSELAWRGKLPPGECLELALSLTLALEHLHRQQLIHRDIKPGNIIYVNAAPKFADVGLVTDMAGGNQEVSNLGTEGYIAPEGAGSASADVYSLGKVLYEACMGRDRRLFPEVPTAVLEQSSDELLSRLNQVIFKACETDPRERYQTALEMRADLLKLRAGPDQAGGGL